MHVTMAVARPFFGGVAIRYVLPEYMQFPTCLTAERFSRFTDIASAATSMSSSRHIASERNTKISSDRTAR